MKKIFLILTLFLSTQVLAGHPSNVNQITPKDQKLSHFFGQILVNTSVRVLYTLTNDSDKDMAIKQITVSGSFFDARHNCPRVLGPRKSCDTYITFFPLTEGSFHGRVTWDTEGGFIDLSLWGTAYRVGRGIGSGN